MQADEIRSRRLSSYKTYGNIKSLADFFSDQYQEHNRARLAHLESLGLPLSSGRVLELGSGVGDHTAFYLQRGCEVVAVDARQDCLDVLKERFPGVETVLCDLNVPKPLRALGEFDIVHCYGILYHLEDPAQLLDYLGDACSGIAIVETCVRPDDAKTVEVVEENRGDYTQSITGKGSRPTRQWVFEKLAHSFPFVYHTRTQPDHPEFPTDWMKLTDAPALIRSVFVASKYALDLAALSPALLDVQERLTGSTNRGSQYADIIRLPLRQEIDQLQRVAAERLAVIEAQEKVIQDLRKAAIERLEVIAEFDAHVAFLKQQLQDVQRGVGVDGELNQTLEERDRRIADLHRALESTRMDATSKDILIEKLNEFLSSQRDQVDEMRKVAEERLRVIEQLDELARERLQVILALNDRLKRG